MSAGMAYEAMNNAGARDKRLIVISTTIYVDRAGRALSLSRRSIPARPIWRSEISSAARQAPAERLGAAAARGRIYPHFWAGGVLFEELGFYYVGPVDGHNLDHLLPVLRNVRDADVGPVLIHVVTQKGKGYEPAERSADKYHGVNKFNVITGAQAVAKPNAPSYTKVFAQSLIQQARKDDKIVAITAAMPAGTARSVRREISERCLCRYCDSRRHLATGLQPKLQPVARSIRLPQRASHCCPFRRADLPVRFAIARPGWSR